MATYSSAAKVTLTSTTDVTTIVAAQGAGTFIYLHGINASNTSATDTTVDLYDGDTQLWEAMPCPAGSGFVDNFTKPLRLSNNAALRVATNNSVASVNVNVKYEVKAY